MKIIGFDPRKMSHNEHINHIKSCIDTPAVEIQKQLDEFCKQCTYLINQDNRNKPFTDLRKHMEEVGNGSEEQDRLFYMALPPKIYLTVSEQLKENCCSRLGASRIIVSHQFQNEKARARTEYLGSKYRSKSLLGGI